MLALHHRLTLVEIAARAAAESPGIRHEVLLRLTLVEIAARAAR